NSVPFTVHPDGSMTCRFVMPFEKSCKIVLENKGHQNVTVTGSALPTVNTLVGWAAAVVVGLGLILTSPRSMQPSPPAKQPHPLTPSPLRREGESKSIGWVRQNGWMMLAAAAVVELFAASQIMAYNQVAPPDVWNAPRFTINQLRVYANEQRPMGRVLSITPLEFDPGDVEALKARYAGLGMSELGIRIALVDTKMREVLAPNLSLMWGIPSVDGFDGGLLPTGYYSDFTALILPDGQEPTTDGRLREMLAQPECRGACIPAQDWLNLSNTRYLITDKTADVWHNDVAYDTTFTLLMADYIESQVNNPIGFQATAVDVLYTRLHCPEDAVCSPIVSTAASETAPYEPLRQMGEREEAGGFQLVRWMMDVQTPFSVALTADRGVLLKIHAVTLVDTRTGDFQQLTLNGWLRVLSSDIKLYENGDVLPRAYVTRLASASIPIEVVMDDPLRYAFIDAPNGDDFGSNTAEVMDYPTAVINSYDAERVEIAVDSLNAAFLVLSDAYYPGWTATVNGETTTIYRTNMMFRGVAIPAGQSTVVFEYRPGWWPGVLIVGIAAWVAIGVGWVVLARRKRSG
ncbi:MAG: YfhO family protein, partial [Anaerolineae bacterium]|nr:YfhO family protein [Anaerolineae bacterium]